MKGLIFLIFLIISKVVFSQSLLNGDFEKLDKSQEFGVQNWVISKVSEGYSISLDSTIYKSANHSIKITDENASGKAGILKQNLEIKNNTETKKYKINGFIKGKDINGFAGIWIRVVQDNSIMFIDDMSSRNINGTFDWKLVNNTFNVPKGNCTVTIGADLTGIGTAWFDDFELIDITNAKTSGADLTGNGTARFDNFELLDIANAKTSKEAQTYVTIIGSIHRPTDNINSEVLYEQLSKIKPDVLLLELDTTLMNEKGEIMCFIDGVEINAAKRLTKDYSVILRPFDCKDRNKYYQEHNTFQKEGTFLKSIDSLYIAKQLDSISRYIYEMYCNLDKVANLYNNGSLADINSEAYQTLTKLRNDVLYNDLLKICTYNKSLQRYKEFWKEDGQYWVYRNKIMVENILQYCNEFKNKKIVILTGAYHKYDLMTLLSEKAKQNNLALKEFWEY